VKPLPILLLTVLAFNVSTAVQGVAASAESISAPPADDGFQSFLSSLENVVADTVSSKFVREQC
jgi:hypothetical protein